MMTTMEMIMMMKMKAVMRRSVRRTEASVDSDHGTSGLHCLCYVF